MTQEFDPKKTPAQQAENEESNLPEPADTEQDELGTPADDLEAKYTELEAKVSQYHDQLLRAHAEMENVRRRAQDDVSKARKFGTESFAESLVPVKDSLEAALALENQSFETLREGLETTLRQLTVAFDRNNLKEVAPAAGDKFDPHVHQAISTIPSEAPAGTVATTLQKGYTIADRVLRPALVTVSAGQG
ncbi:molecular chaperone GrpE [Advenella kashmirensis W13003]|uniref:Protein GrpE n=1 Tax=Advenella kashmirensis W13003 TaxID=1424334 RepID=V8QP60_9BURK|nr:nucleotide exchange factor GrpE [Advenella kashmirensis]ETF00784.1 molecular chaperone GrpE [Advenella kashmirensis W13003]